MPLLKNKINVNRFILCVTFYSYSRIALKRIRDDPGGGVLCSFGAELHHVVASRSCNLSQLKHAPFILKVDRSRSENLAVVDFLENISEKNSHTVVFMEYACIADTSLLNTIV